MATSNYRTALALNNIGVALLQRGDAFAALQALQESKLLMDHCHHHSTCCSSSSHHHGDDLGNSNHHHPQQICQNSNNGPCHALQKASLRYTDSHQQLLYRQQQQEEQHEQQQQQQPTEMFSSSSPQGQNQQQPQTACADVYILEDEDYATVRQAANFGAGAMFPIRITSFHHDEIMSGSGGMLIMKHTVIVLYNLALASLLASAVIMAQGQGQVDPNQAQQQQAALLLKTSLETLQMTEVLIQDALESTMDLDDDQELLFLLLSALVLNCSSVVYRCLGLPYQSQEAHRLGAIICAEVDDDDGGFASILAQPVLAAAA